MTRALSAATVLALGGCRIDTEIEVATVTDAVVETDEGSAGGSDAESTSGSADDTATTGEGAALPFPPAGPDAAPDPSVFGPYPVGVTTLSLVDTARMDDEGRPRPVVTEVWYPAVEDARGQPGYVYGLADVLRPEALELVDTMGIAVELPTEAVRDAVPRDDGERFPVVLFSHGASGVRMQSTFLTAALASHGYVVASPDHFGNTLSDTIVAGGFEQEDLLVAMGVRPGDLLFVLEELEGLGDADPLGAIVDGDRVGVAGHSFGAWTALRLLALGHAFPAVVAQAPPGADIVWLGNPAVSAAEVEANVMIHAGVADSTTPIDDARSIYDQLGGPRHLLTLETGGHFTFSDMCRLDPAAIEGAMMLGIGAALDDGCADGFIAPEIALPTQRHFAIAHFNAVLRDSPGSAALLTAGEAERLAPGEGDYASN
jgi:predicted dienelactone hydrolase